MSTDLDILPLESWSPYSSDLFLIAGPCSAETKDQVLSTARLVTEHTSVKIFRAGVWKPRTRPDGFEGSGAKALNWLVEAKKQTGLLPAVEVANPHHVEACLKHGIDYLWIGARTTVNPFSVQEIAESLKGVDIPVFVKNPLHPDLKLWIGAFERLNSVGLKKLVAIHRGFYTYDNGPYRNLPMWEIPIELKRLSNNLPLICDPSHIGGRRNMIFEISQKALDLAFDGLIIETHNMPDNAKTDAQQQITPLELGNILQSLVKRKEYGTEDFENELEKLRREVDKLDAEILQVLSLRMQKIEEIGRYKKANNITVLQIDRLRKMVISRLKSGQELGLDPKFILKLLQLVHKESIQLQTSLMIENNRDGKI